MFPKVPIGVTVSIEIICDVIDGVESASFVDDCNNVGDAVLVVEEVTSWVDVTMVMSVGDKMSVLVLTSGVKSVSSV